MVSCSLGYSGTHRVCCFFWFVFLIFRYMLPKYVNPYVRVTWVMEDSGRRAGGQRRESLELHGASMFQ